ncbi:unnamed protein product [Rotaria socialis]|uniref:3-oxoacyl-[acyl-carrier-protein] reductase n=1 Tax=Rotaria socialis TaxID=392032 RepID=A0A820WJI5_9BILA|nr:unnamed protein product [Rotaria socialis]CAF4518416.1 unnamed protein product [Rotaria socialis]
MKRITALIISSLNGFSLNIVRKLAEQGYNIALNENQNDDNIIETIQKEHKQCRTMYVPDSIKNEIDIHNLVEQISKQFQHIDIVIIHHECKRHYTASIDEFPTENWREAFDYNLIITFALVKTLWPHMKRQHSGNIKTSLFEQYDHIKTLADLILFLSSDQARSITGQSIPWCLTQFYFNVDERLICQ